MMSLWGKLTKPSMSAEEADEKFYFTTSTGQIVSADGSGYVIPAIADEAVEKAEYIPLEFAQSKVKDMADESLRLREAYQQHLSELDTYYRKSMSDTKTHYETLIKDLKGKALRHVEIRKQLQQQAEQKLKDELKVSEDSVEELRDSMASLNREYQEEVRSLKSSINEYARAAEKMKGEIDTLQANADHVEAVADAKHKNELDSREECRGALLSVLHKIEIQTLREQLRKLQGAQKQVAHLQAEVLDLDAKNRTCHEQLEQVDRDREEAAAQQEQNLRDVAALQEEHTAEVGRLKEKFSGQLKAAKQQYLTKLKQLQGKLQRSEVQVCLTALVGRVVDQHSSGLVSELKGSYSATSIQHAQQEEQLIDQYERQLAAQRAKFEDQHQAMKKKFTAKMQAAGERIKRNDVQLCVRDLVLTVVERSVQPVRAPAPASPRTPRVQPSVSVPATPAMVDLQMGEGMVRSSEHAALLEKVQQLEEQVAEQQRAFERQLDEAGKAAPPQASAEPTPSAAVVPAVAAGPTPDQLAWREQLAALKKQAAALRPQAADAAAALKQCSTALDALNEDKEVCKNDIKDWSRAFVEANGREPNVQDKATVKDKYQKYKVLSAKVKDLEGNLETCKQADAEKSGALKSVQQEIARLSELLATSGANAVAGGVAGAAGPSRPFVETTDAEIQTEDSRGGMLRRQNTQKAIDGASAKQKLTGDQLRIAELEEGRDADSLTIEQLDDQLYQLRQDFEKALAEKEALAKEQVFLQSQVDGLVKEKRTDVVKRYEEEIERLNVSQSALNEKIAALTATKVTNEARMTELQSRVDVAEAELKERDAKELQGLEPKDEKALLKGQITKQREQIILKAKAATAGWDAAAHSDERLDVEVERAFKKGFAEERKKHIDDMAALNAAIEVKENRITELLVSMADMERRVMQSDAKVADMTKQTEAMKLEVADTIASLSMMAMSGGGSGGEDGEAMMGPTNAELDSAREQLDLAQEELVGLMERCDRLDTELEVARRKNRVYEELAAITGINNADLAMKKAKANGGGATAQKSAGSKGPGPANSIYDSNEAMNIIKKAVVKGTNLWKSNRKDDCFDVYADACQDCLDRLLSPDLRSGLVDAISNGKTLAVQNKQRGAVVVRKALDKLLSDLEKPNIKKAEDDEVAKLRGQAAEAQEVEDGQTGDHVNELVEELNQIENSFLEQGYTKERNPSNSSSTGEAQSSPRPDNSAGSLLARAKTAEAQVIALKKQLAAVVAATAARSGEASGAAPAAAGGAAGALAARRPAASAATGADPAEVRKLNRKIKDLEAQIKSGAGGGGVASADMKALQQNEKVLQKKLKDVESNFKRESKGIEMRAVKAENALQKIESTYTSVVSERDKLKTENTKLSGLTGELAALKAKTEYFLQVEAQLGTKTQEYDMLAEQFKKETTLRKKYKNELEDLKGAIRVYARCRPMAKYEIEKGCKSVVEIKDETSLKVITSRGDKDFEFDAVFSDMSTQDQVFEDTKRLVESCIDGFNVCLFAYGQTGSGKTFTMTGSPSMPGLTPKAIGELYRLIEERVHLNVRVTTYFVELYNDNLVDLYWILDNKGKAGNLEPPKLDIKMDAKKMVYIRNAVIKDATSPSELMDLFNAGNVERHTGATKMNAESSRSHSIFAIMVDCYDTATKRTTTGKLSLVDLAGSERADKTGAAAERLKEAQNINKSLSALGDVIAALSEGNKFVPYRNNKLTQLMQDSLGGNAKTLMFVNFSPADYNSDETSTSLMYAARVKKIVNNASKQAESEEVARLKHIIKRLQAGLPVEIQEAAVEEEEPAPAPADDGKTYDGY